MTARSALCCSRTQRFAAQEQCPINSIRSEGDPMNKPSRVVQRKHRKKKGKKVSLRNQ